MTHDDGRERERAKGRVKYKTAVRKGRKENVREYKSEWKRETAE